MTHTKSPAFRDYIQSLVLAALVCASALSLAGCTKPTIIKEPHPVKVVREVVVPIPDEYTRSIPTPRLPEGALTGQDLVNHILEWKAWGKTVLEHRGKVKQLSEGRK